MKLKLARETILKIEAEVVASETNKDVSTTAGMRNVIYLETEGNVLRIIGSSRELEIADDLGLPDKLPGGKALFGGRKLLDICRTLPEGSAVDMDVGKGIEAKAGKVRFKLNGIEPEEFAEMRMVAGEEGEWKHRFSLPVSTFSRLLRKTAPIMPVDDVRYYLNGIMFELRPGQIRAVSTDGHRLVMCTADVPECKPGKQPAQLIIPSPAVKLFQQWFTDAEAGEEEGADLLDFEASERCLRIKRGIRTVTALLVDGKFPDYEKVIPDSMPQEVVVSVAEMRSAMERVLVLRGADGASVSNPRVILDIKKDNMHSSTENDSGESIEEDIAVEHKGEGIKIAFNASYIKDILDNMDTEKARMSLKESSGSILMQEAKDGADTQYVVMPMNL